ncbi:MAG: hypothetical protein HYW25_03795 [Candidatus Aenigmarchaeota archaeon]|nr:hypothetical protein [Candidatus Aenigmarchaeota archaeon]
MSGETVEVQVNSPPKVLGREIDKATILNISPRIENAPYIFVQKASGVYFGCACCPDKSCNSGGCCSGCACRCDDVGEPKTGRERALDKRPYKM